MFWEFIDQASSSSLHWASYLCHAWAKIIDQLLLIFPFYKCIQSQQLIVFLDFSISIFNHLHNLDDTSVYVHENTCIAHDILCSNSVHAYLPVQGIAFDVRVIVVVCVGISSTSCLNFRNTPFEWWHMEQWIEEGKEMYEAMHVPLM
jgi:hypothetical protein